MTLSLKLATAGDIPASVDLIQDLFNNSVYSKSTKFVRLDVIDNLTSFLDRPEEGCVLLLQENGTTIGILVASYMKHLFNVKEKTAVELAFWITPASRSLASLKLMLKAYRYWARKVGCTSIMMGKLTNDTATEHYSLRRL